MNTAPAASPVSAIAFGAYSGQSSDALPPGLRTLIEGLDASHQSPAAGFSKAVTGALARSLDVRNWLPAEMLEADASSYARRLVYGDPAGRYSILAITWGPGQQSPVHLHHTWCAVGVYQGALEEYQYATPGPGEHPRLIDSQARRVGDCTFDPRMTATHRIANVTQANAVSIHVYGVAHDQIASGVNLVVA